MPHVHALPPELLLQIFLYFLAIPTRYSWSKPTVRHSKDTLSNPILLTHVCHYWRKVATSFPDLWTQIFILGPGTSNLSPLITLWLSRAEGYAMGIQFVERCFAPGCRGGDRKCRHKDEVTTLSNRLLSETLWQFRSCWNKIDFEFANFGPTESAVDRMTVTKIMPGSDALDVRSARIIDRRDWDQGLTGPLWWRVVYSPTLVNLEVGALCVGPPLPGLQELVCHEPMLLTQVAHILAMCPNLVKVNVAILGTENGIDNEIPEEIDIFCEHLKHLAITNSNDIRITPMTLLDSLTCPVLEYLDVGFTGNEPNFHETILHFLDDSGCSLTTLKGVLIEPIPDSYLNRFFALPALQSLTSLKVSRATVQFLQLLTIPFISLQSRSQGHAQTCTPILPHLCNLEIENMQRCNWEFSNMLLSRMDTLKKVNLIGNQSVPPVHLSQRLLNHPYLRIKIARQFP